MMMSDKGVFEIVSLNISEQTGTRKKPVSFASFEKGLGMVGDAHAGILEKRQVSLLAVEEIEAASLTLKAAGGGKLASLSPGDYAENVTTRGIALHELPLGTMLRIGSAVLEVSQIGKECHASCEIRRLVGDCVMPRKGIFARVLVSGEIRAGDLGSFSATAE